jgi:hypothetical protein
MTAAPAEPPARRALRSVALWTAFAALLLVLRPYRGVFHDGRIYIGRAMANLDPAGVGRDLMYAHDAQTGFSLYPRLATALAAALGPSGASMLLSLAGLLVWGAAAITLMRRIAPGRLGWAAAGAVFALPASYGAFYSFSYGEAWATPRAFAEAAVLLSLTALFAGRWRWSLAALAAAALFHPLMA